MNSIDLEQWEQTGSPGQYFWALVLIFAIREKANRIEYDPIRLDDALICEIGETRRRLVAPDASLAEEIERVITDLISELKPRRFFDFIRGRSNRTGSTSTGDLIVRVGGIETQLNCHTDREHSQVSFCLDPNSAAAEAAGIALDSIHKRTKANDLEK